jgi:hypothetical protein
MIQIKRRLDMAKTERSFYLGVIAVLSLLLFLQRACNHPIKAECPQEVSFIESNGIVTDTVTVEKKDSSSWHHPKEMSGASKQAQKGSIWPSNDSSFQSLPESVRNSQKNASQKDSLALADFWKSKDYVDTFNYQAGQVIVRNRVQANNLEVQQVLLNAHEKTITVKETVTKTVKEKPHGQLFAGILFQGHQFEILSGFGGQFIYKSKKDNVWTGAVMFTTSGQKIYQIGGAIPIFK